MKKPLVTAVTVVMMLSLLIPFSSCQNVSTQIGAAAPAIPPASDPVPGGTLDPLTIQKFVDPLPIPGVMPQSTNRPKGLESDIDYYEIAVTQFQQQVLSTGQPKTTVWGYGPVGGTGSYPSRAIEAKNDRPVQVKWINGLVDANNNYLPHLLSIDQTLHWANPPGGEMGRDMAGTSQSPYKGPVPIVTHLHGAHVTEESDGYPTAWYLPAANNIPAGYAKVGSLNDEYSKMAKKAFDAKWDPGTATFQYPNDQRATTLWFHDHSLGMTRANVYAGPVGFYLIRGGSDDVDPGKLPSGAYEIPIVLQDKSFNSDGSLFYPDNRAFFEGLEKPQLQIPFVADATLDGGPSDISPIWNPEFFGNTVVVNGKTWPYLNVEQGRYRMRFLNGSDSRFFILDIPAGVKAWVIGTDGGFLPKPVSQNQLLIAPAERMDVIMDFSGIQAGKNIVLRNIGPDEPFGGGQPGTDFAASNTDTTGQVMQFRVVKRSGKDTSIAPNKLELPKRKQLGQPDNTPIEVSLNELESETVFVPVDADGNYILDAGGNLVAVPSSDPNAAAFAPAEAALGNMNPDGTGNPLEFADPVTEKPKVGSTEIWEIHNFTEDAHPIHIHLVQFEVVERVDAQGVARPPEAWETGTKDTVIAYPGEVTRVKAKFDLVGLYLWHCHILSHEDNEMMRPYEVVP